MDYLQQTPVKLTQEGLREPERHKEQSLSSHLSTDTTAQNVRCINDEIT